MLQKDAAAAAASVGRADRLAVSDRSGGRCIVSIVSPAPADQGGSGGRAAKESPLAFRSLNTRSEVTAALEAGRRLARLSSGALGAVNLVAMLFSRGALRSSKKPWYPFSASTLAIGVPANAWRCWPVSADCIGWGKSGAGSPQAL